MASIEALLEQIDFFKARIEALEKQNESLNSELHKAKELLTNLVEEWQTLETLEEKV